MLEHLRLESVIKVSGEVISRIKETKNKKITTGDIEVLIDQVEIISVSNVLPMQVAGNEYYGDEIRLKK